MKGLIHIYTGDGKGKTTASLGLCMRFAGSGGKVIFTQFLKNDNSNEIKILDKIPEITFIPSGKYFGFTRQMTPETRKEARLHYSRHLDKVINETLAGRYGLLVLDEVIAADNSGLIPHNLLAGFLRDKPESLEIVLTGRNPAEDLLEIADYVSDIKKAKHPFDKNIPARTGIEM